MKKLLILVIAFLFFCSTAWAVPIQWNSGNHIIQTGDLINETLLTYNNTNVDMSGGEISGSLGIHDASIFNISNGTLHGVTTYSGGTLNFSGGIMNALQAYDHSIVNISGGKILTGYVYAVHSVVINVFGYDFNYIPGGIYDGGTFSGFWGDGTSFVMNLNDWAVSGNHTYDHIVLHQIPNPVPEPSTWILLTIGLIGITVVSIRKKLFLNKRGVL